MYNWIEDTMNRCRRNGSNWLHDIGPEEVQKGFFAIIRDIESGHFNMKYFESVILDEIFINESYSAARHRANDAYYKLWALSFFAERVRAGEPDPNHIMYEYSMIKFEQDSYAAWVKWVDAYRFTKDPNMMLRAIDDVTTIGKRKKIAKDLEEINSKPQNVLWEQYKSISPGIVDRFIRNIGKGKVPATDIIDAAVKQPAIVYKAYEVAKKRVALHGEIEAGYRKILDLNPMDPDQHVWTAYPSCKRTLTAYNILTEKLETLGQLNPNSPIFRNYVITLKSLLIRDYNGAL